jgi:hemoglobin-like flavoprotein
MEAFYARLFEVDPSTKPLFAKSDMVKQGKATGDMISAAVDGLGDLAALVPVLQVCCVLSLNFLQLVVTVRPSLRFVQGLGARHLNYGVKAEHYPSVGQALLVPATWIICLYFMVFFNIIERPFIADIAFVAGHLGFQVGRQVHQGTQGGVGLGVWHHCGYHANQGQVRGLYLRSNHV